MTLVTELKQDARATKETERPARRPLDPTLIVSAITILAMLVLWTFASNAGLVSKVFLPSPLTVLKSADNLITTGFVDSTLAQHTMASLGRIFGALAAAVVIGVPAGLAIATSRIGKGILDPIVEFLRPLPPLAYLPLIIIWLGIGEASKITVIALAMLPPIIISTAAGVKSASKDHINAARSFGATRLQLLRHVILPGAVPSILTGIRIALGAGWSTLVAAELIAASRGLGFMIQSAAQFLVTDIVIAGIFVIAIIAFLFELVARLVERLLVPWAAHR
ncbi:ABC transporter permease subunit [Rhizobium sp. TH2]|uniref:ABC transporter permease subunit n=1 Tax=Rhizobium sp. TH2 TaxID=2775403 RepID=UPI00215843E8|nr:ABC transporter permease subunit [Rhizobium sp. TH2]UVC06928.1 ABC transporter permease subunit [Rhizobium sp. TH2]